MKPKDRLEIQKRFERRVDPKRLLSPEDRQVAMTAAWQVYYWRLAQKQAAGRTRAARLAPRSKPPVKPGA